MQLLVPLPLMQGCGLHCFQLWCTCSNDSSSLGETSHVSGRVRAKLIEYHVFQLQQEMILPPQS